jgi:hypothetical protein
MTLGGLITFNADAMRSHRNFCLRSPRFPQRVWKAAAPGLGLERYRILQNIPRWYARWYAKRGRFLEFTQDRAVCSPYIMKRVP